MEHCQSVSKNWKLRPLRLTSKHEYVGNIKNLQVYGSWVGDGEYRIDVVIDNGNTKVDSVMQLWLYEERENIYSITMVRIGPQYQGFGLAPKVYKFLMRKMGIKLMTATLQSPGGQAIWWEMARSGVKISGITYRGRKVFDVEPDTDQKRMISHEIDLWNPRNRIEMVASV